MHFYIVSTAPEDVPTKPHRGKGDLLSNFTSPEGRGGGRRGGRLKSECIVFVLHFGLLKFY